MKDFIRKLLTRWVHVLIRSDLVDQASFQLGLLDHLTRLPNRQAMIDRLRAARSGGINGVIGYCDVDGFKMVNDAYGHGVGDEMLTALTGW